MRNLLTITPLQQSEKKLKKGVDRNTGAGYDIAMIKVDNAMNGNTQEGDIMTAQEQQAYKAGVEDAQHGSTVALKACKDGAANGSAPCKAYLQGYYGSGIGE